MTDMDMVHTIFEDLKNEKELALLDLEKKRGAAYDWIENPEKIVVGLTNFVFRYGFFKIK